MGCLRKPCGWRKRGKNRVGGEEVREEAGPGHVGLVCHFQDFVFYLERGETLQERFEKSDF